MTALITQDKPLHWAEAFGLSVAIHVGLAYLLLTTVVDVTAVFPERAEAPAPLQITTLSIETGILTDVSETGTDAVARSVTESLAPTTTADTLAPVAAEEPSPQIADNAPETPTAATAEATVTPPAVTTPTLSPLRPETAISAPVIAPVETPTIAPSVQTLAPVNPVAPASPAPQTAPAEPRASPAPSAPAPGAPDPLAADLINRIRANVGDACLIAIPQQVAGTVSLALFTADEAAVAPYLDDIFTGLTPPPVQTTLIDARQCAALDFIRQNANYPAFALGLGLTADRIATGDTLTGTITGTGGRALTLLIVDDNGVTQTLNAYITASANAARFAAPLRRASSARDTRQLLIALGTSRPPATATTQNGQLAADYFPQLQNEVGATATLALVPFDVR